jgi:hypothetical protein
MNETFETGTRPTPQPVAEPLTPAVSDVSPIESPIEPPIEPMLPIKATPLVRWRKLLTLSAIYVITETALDLAGLDTLANYSEFINNGQVALQTVSEALVNFAHLIP